MAQLQRKGDIVIGSLAEYVHLRYCLKKQCDTGSGTAGTACASSSSSSRAKPKGKDFKKWEKKWLVLNSELSPSKCSIHFCKSEKEWLQNKNIYLLCYLGNFKLSQIDPQKVDRKHKNCLELVFSDSSLQISFDSFTKMMSWRKYLQDINSRYAVQLVRSSTRPDLKGAYVVVPSPDDVYWFWRDAGSSSSDCSPLWGWRLQQLRRVKYHSESDEFVVEAGRSAPTGEGFFSFTGFVVKRFYELVSKRMNNSPLQAEARKVSTSTPHHSGSNGARVGTVPTSVQAATSAQLLRGNSLSPNSVVDHFEVGGHSRSLPSSVLSALSPSHSVPSLRRSLNAGILQTGSPGCVVHQQSQRLPPRRAESMRPSSSFTEAHGLCKSNSPVSERPPLPPPLPPTIQVNEDEEDELEYHYVSNEPRNLHLMFSSSVSIDSSDSEDDKESFSSGSYMHMLHSSYIPDDVYTDPNTASVTEVDCEKEDYVVPNRINVSQADYEEDEYVYSNTTDVSSQVDHEGKCGDPNTKNVSQVEYEDVFNTTNVPEVDYENATYINNSSVASCSNDTASDPIGPLPDKTSNDCGTVIATPSITEEKPTTPSNEFAQFRQSSKNANNSTGQSEESSGVSPVASGSQDYDDVGQASQERSHQPPVDSASDSEEEYYNFKGKIQR